MQMQIQEEGHSNFHYLSLRSVDLKEIYRRFLKRPDLVLSTVRQSRDATVDGLLARIMSAMSNAAFYDCRLWILRGAAWNLDKLYTYLYRAAEKANYEYRINAVGDWLEGETPLRLLEIQQGDFFIVQAKEKGRRWFLQGKDEQKCEGCFERTVLRFLCECQEVAYCSEQCRLSDKGFHIRNCLGPKQQELQNAPLKYFNSEDYPEFLLCPISHTLMTTPMLITVCGHTFENRSIRTWLSRKSSCPLCGAKVPPGNVLVKNYFAAEALQRIK